MADIKYNPLRRIDYDRDFAYLKKHETEAAVFGLPTIKLFRLDKEKTPIHDLYAESPPEDLVFGSDVYYPHAILSSVDEITKTTVFGEEVVFDGVIKLFTYELEKLGCSDVDSGWVIGFTGGERLFELFISHVGTDHDSWSPNTNIHTRINVYVNAFRRSSTHYVESTVIQEVGQPDSIDNERLEKVNQDKTIYWDN